MSNTKLKIISDNPVPRSPERAALAETTARRDSMAWEIQDAKSAWSKALEYCADAESKPEKARASNEQISVDSYIAAVSAGGICEAAPAVDIRQLEQELEHWQLMTGACLARVNELERLADFVPVQSKVEAVIKSEADVLGLLDGFEALRGELDRRLSVLSWLHCNQLIKEDDLPAVASAIASCYVLPRDEDAVRTWREAVKALASDADFEITEGEIMSTSSTTISVAGVAQNVGPLSANTYMSFSNGGADDPIIVSVNGLPASLTNGVKIIGTVLVTPRVQIRGYGLLSRATHFRSGRLHKQVLTITYS